MLRTRKESSSGRAAGEHAKLRDVPPRSPRTGSFLAGVLLGILALFMLEASLREICVAINHDRYFKDQFELEYYSESTGGISDSSLSGHVICTGEHFRLSMYPMKLEQLRELNRKKQLEGFRTPIWYLPPRGIWPRVDRILGFRVLSPDAFELPDGFRFTVTLINVLLVISGFLLIRRGVRGMPSPPPPESRK